MARNWSTPESWTDEKAVSVARLQAISDNLQFLLDTMYAKMTSATISGGTLTLTENEGVYALSGEGGAADTLTDISGGEDGDIIILWYAGETITLAESGNLDNGDYGSFDLSDASHFATYYRESSVWRLKSTSVHNKTIHDALNIDADTVDGEEAADIVTKARVDAVDADADTVDGEHASGIVTTARVNSALTQLQQDLDANNKGLKNLQQVDFNSVVDNGNSGTSQTINWQSGNKQEVTLTGDCTFSFTAPDGPCNLTLVMIGDGTVRSLTWPGSVDWGADGEPDWTGTSGAKNIVSLFYDGTDYIARGSAG